MCQSIFWLKEDFIDQGWTLKMASIKPFAIYLIYCIQYRYPPNMLIIFSKSNLIFPLLALENFKSFKEEQTIQKLNILNSWFPVDPDIPAISYHHNQTPDIPANSYPYKQLSPQTAIPTSSYPRKQLHLMLVMNRPDSRCSNSTVNIERIQISFQSKSN